MQTALVLDSSDVWSMNNLGYLLIQEGAFEDALRPLSRATELAPEVATFQNNLGVALERTGHYVLAAAAYRAAVEDDSTFAKASVNLERVTALSEDPIAPFAVWFHPLVGRLRSQHFLIALRTKLPRPLAVN